jgi:hypothetical protein
MRSGKVRYNLADLEELCRTREPESLTLEFKPCNELRAGVVRRQGEPLHSHDDVVMEMSRDISAFLNSAGGTLIYGIREKRSRAEQLDRAHAFRKKRKAEWLTQLLRAHISPSPSMVNVYQVALDEASWFLVVDITQGQAAYQAKDKRFYKRIGNTLAPMEQYEVADAMRRERGPQLELKLTPELLSQPTSGPAAFNLRLAVTSENYVSAEHGVIAFSLVPPLSLNADAFGARFREAGEDEVGPKRYVDPHLKVGDQEVSVRRCKIRWGANHGNVVFPADWYEFHGAPLPLQIRRFRESPQQIYGFAAELFTVNSPARMRFFLLHKPLALEADSLDLERVDAERFERFLKEMPRQYQR